MGDEFQAGERVKRKAGSRRRGGTKSEGTFVRYCPYLPGWIRVLFDGSKTPSDQIAKNWERVTPLPPTPDWRDAPPAPGEYIRQCPGVRSVHVLTAADVAFYAGKPSGRWYGPIPPDRGG
jgi:hypothetical protein